MDPFFMTSKYAYVCTLVRPLFSKKDRYIKGMHLSSSENNIYLNIGIICHISPRWLARRDDK